MSRVRAPSFAVSPVSHKKTGNLLQTVFLKPNRNRFPVVYSISKSGGTSSWWGTGRPFFFRWRTHSVSRYSICPFTERKSSSAQAAIAAYKAADRRSGICFFSPAISTSCRNSLPAAHPGCRREPPEDWRPLRLFVLHPASRPGFRSGVPEPSQPYQQHRLQSFCGRQ